MNDYYPETPNQLLQGVVFPALPNRPGSSTKLDTALLRTWDDRIALKLVINGNEVEFNTQRDLYHLASIVQLAIQAIDASDQEDADPDTFLNDALHFAADLHRGVRGVATREA